MEIKCIAFDLDGTLFRSDGTLSERTRNVLNKALEQEICVVPVTGRPLSTIPDEIRHMEKIRCAVTSNGAAVYDLRTGEQLQGWKLNAKDVRAITRIMGNYFLEGMITYEAFVDGIGYAPADYVRNPMRFGIPAKTVSYIQTTRKPHPYIIDFIYENASKLDCLDIILKQDYLYNMMKKQLENGTDQIYITSAVPYRMEISHAKANKATGLSFVLEQLGIDPAQTVAFGDGDNDADLLTAAGVGVAMGNATADCKAAADATTGTNDEDGLAAYLEQVL